jgi:hypothetical protein
MILQINWFSIVDATREAEWLASPTSPKIRLVSQAALSQAKLLRASSLISVLDGVMPMPSWIAHLRFSQAKLQWARQYQDMVLEQLREISYIIL